MEAIRYDKKYLDQWDSFVDGSNNGTIFHTRKFLSYHPAERFKDSSLLFFSKRKLISVLTGAEVMKDGAKCLISHQGASYGGFIYNDDLSLKQAFELTERLVEFAEENGFQRLIITHSPFVYQSRYNNYVDFAFISRGFRYLKREVSSIVVLDVVESDVFTLFKPEARTAVRKAERSGVLIKRSDDFQQYYRILKSNLALRHNVKPAHSLEELIRIQKLFPDDVELIGAFGYRNCFRTM